jgi:uncharacterized protein YbaP (TraB family)
MTSGDPVPLRPACLLPALLLFANAALAEAPPTQPQSGVAEAAVAEEAVAEEAVAEPTTFDELLVSGEQPGPGLWRVSRRTEDGENVLWILGSYGPLPAKMKWRAAQVERTLAQSQEVIGPATVDADVGFFRGVTLLPSLVGIRKNPGGETLQELVPPDLYERWLALKRQYLGNDRSVEKWRPIFAAGELYEKAIEDAGLQRSNRVWPVVEKAAKRHKVPVTRPTVAIPVEKPRDLIREFKQAELEDLDCFAKTLERLESDLDLMRVRANAWATGDIGTLQELAPVDQVGACLSVVTGSDLLQSRGLSDLPSRLTAAWLAAAEDALSRNASTLAVLWISEILRPDGIVDQLRAKGYTVEAP